MLIYHFLAVVYCLSYLSACFPSFRCRPHLVLLAITSQPWAWYLPFWLYSYSKRHWWPTVLIWNLLRASILTRRLVLVKRDGEVQSGALDCNIPSNPHGNNLGLSWCCLSVASLMWIFLRLQQAYRLQWYHFCPFQSEISGDSFMPLRPLMTLSFMTRGSGQWCSTTMAYYYVHEWRLWGVSAERHTHRLNKTLTQI